MKHSHWFAKPSLGIALLGALVLSGCGSKESKFYGTYEEPKQGGKLVLQAEHKATFSIGSGPAADITWEMAGDDKVTLHILALPTTWFRISDGSLRDPEGAVWKKK